MSNEKMFNANEVCAELNITFWTLRNWYQWESLALREGNISSKYLPEPIRDCTKKGKPRLWTESMIEALKNYKSTIVTGRNGVYGVYTNPSHKNTKKYKKSLQNN